VADTGTSAVNSPVRSRSRTYAVLTGSPERVTTPWMTASRSTSTPSRLGPPLFAPHMSGLPALVAERDGNAAQ
jgi:hypothetical protein